MTARRIAIYGDVDLNYIDGSSVWLVSLCSVLARIPGLRVELILGAPIQRTVLTSSLPGSILVHEPANRRSVRGAVETLLDLDRREPFDVVVVRGRDLAARLVEHPVIGSKLWAYLTDVPQQRDELGGEAERQLRSILANASRVLCQTEDMRAWFASLAPEADRKLLLLPPLVPDAAYRPHPRPWMQDGLRLLYAGKFAPEWGFVEVVDRVRRLRESGVDVSLVVAGDKIHDPPERPDFAPSVRQALADPAVDWRGGVSRSEVFELLDNVDMALSIRSSALDDSRELSTKLLEYSASGVPVVANRTRAHLELFGGDYPFLVSSFDALDHVIRRVLSSPDILEWTSKLVRDLADGYSYSSAARALASALEAVPSRRRLRGRPRILVAGHDFKFIQPLMEGWVNQGYEVATDPWRGHDRHDAARSTQLLGEADIVVCEWLLGNAVYYASHASPKQPVVVRLHRMEVETEWPRRLPLDDVARVVVVSDHIKRQLVSQFDYPAEKVQVIFNGVDPLAYDRPKLPGARFTLGMLGYLPQLKRLDRAIHLLRRLREDDARYRLVVKGKRPDQLDWVWRNPDERSYFEAIRREVENDPVLRGAVVFEPAGPDTPSWFRKVGYVLSPSDVESFHLAMVEGMASGAVPVVWDRDGASDLVDPWWIHESTEEAARWMLEQAPEWSSESRASQTLVRERYALSLVRTEWGDLLEKVRMGRSTVETTGRRWRGSPAFEDLPATQLVGHIKSVVSGKQSPPVSYPYRYSTDAPTEADLAAVKALANGHFQPSRLFSSVAMPMPPDWQENPFENRTWDFHRHSLEWLEPVVRAATTDPTARRLAIEVVKSWIHTNSLPPGRTPYVWNDHTAAIRTRLLLYLLHLFDLHGMWDGSDRDLILASLIQHGAFLADDDHYSANSNHGLEMDASLMALSLSLPEIRFSKRWREIADRRMDTYVAANYSRRFVHLEQSPAYHLFVTVRLMSVMSFLKSNGFSVPFSLGRLVRGAAAVWPYLRRPDRSAPMIGDTPQFPRPVDFERVHERLLGTRPHSVAPEDKLNPRNDGAAAFVDIEAGYAVYSDREPTPEPELDQRSFQVVVKCNTFDSPHYHHDAGSFVVWWEGREWIVDSGYYSMEERTAERRYMRSARAHNVVLADGEDFGFRPFKVNEVFREDQGDGVEMVHDLGSVVHTRRLTVDPAARTITVRDETESLDGDAHEITQLLHLSPEVEMIERSENRLLGVLEGRGVLITRSSEREGNFEIVRGDHDGRPVAWYSEDYLQRRASTVGIWKVLVDQPVVTELTLRFLEPSALAVEGGVDGG